MKSALIVTSVASMVDQFLLSSIQLLQDMNYEVTVACNFENGSTCSAERIVELKQRLDDLKVEYHHLNFDRNIFSFSNNYSAYKALKKLVTTKKYTLVHCHSPIGGIVTRLACIKTRKKGTKVLYTAHGFHFYKGAPLKNWLMYYPIEKFFSRLCDMVITINKEDYECAKKHFKTEIKRIHGIGVDPERFYPANEIKKQELREYCGLSKEDFVIICTGELNDNKNQKLLIDATDILKRRIPNIKVLLAGNGPNREILSEYIKKLNLQNFVNLLGYRSDLEKIIPATDLIVSCSIREGLGLNVIEGMMCQKAVVATYNRGHKELIQDGINGYLVPHDNADYLAECIHKIYTNPYIADDFAIKNFDITKMYSTNHVCEEISRFY